MSSSRQSCRRSSESKRRRRGKEGWEQQWDDLMWGTCCWLAVVVYCEQDDMMVGMPQVLVCLLACLAAGVRRVRWVLCGALYGWSFTAVQLCE